ncbi:FAD-dependent monooxygenase [Nocardioides litoris]|uniref:FAD-dependent monooxygenase n=1 Tax=Nocardioides litoris TaxID=1926648 RepID=UPI00111D27E1|nr:FAD-dependent monooxygenase [Nocardioides litoris]
MAQTSTPRRALVSGGSIAGLSAAYWLALDGWQVTLVERAPGFRDGGQNVDVRGVGHEVLDRMGLVETIRALGTGETGTVAVDEDDRVVAIFPDVGPDSATAELEVLRGDLARAIHDVLPADVEVRYDETVSEVVDLGGTVRVTTTRRPAEEVDLLVVAEGVRSTTRDLVLDGGDVELRPLGIDMVFGTIPRLESDDTRWRWMTTTGGRQAHLRPDGRGGTRAILSFAPSRQVSDLDPAARQALLEERYAGVGWAVPRILRGLATSHDVYADSLTQVRARTWHRGRAVLVGDAAWCVTPLGGGGATLALTSGYVLAAQLSRATDVPAALERFEAWMRPLVDDVQTLPPGLDRLAYPRTALGLRASRTVTRLVTSRLLRPIAARATQVAHTDQELPRLEPSSA